MIDSFIRNSNEIATTTEIGFNIADSVPVVGAATSAFRALVSLVQMVAFGILELVCLAGEAFNQSRSKSAVRDYQRLSEFAEEQLGMGILNLIRSCLEFTGQSLTFGIANIVVNLCMETPFLPVISYTGVKNRNPLKGY